MDDSIQIITGTGVSANIKTVMTMLDCREDNPIYDEISDIYDEQKPVVENIIRPVGAFKEGKLLRKGSNDDLPIGRDIIYSLSTVGQEICDYIDKCMKEDPLLGMIVDFMADSCLFAFEEQLRSAIRKYCIDKGIGIHKSYEAPGFVSMECQKDAWEVLDAEHTLNMSITSGFMLRPIKSNGHIYTISEDKNEFSLNHDCSACTMTNCPMKKVNCQ